MFLFLLCSLVKTTTKGRSDIKGATEACGPDAVWLYMREMHDGGTLQWSLDY